MIVLVGCILIIVAILLLLRCKSGNAESDTASIEIPYGPFVVHADANTGKTFDRNYGMVKYTNVKYSVWYEGKPVAFPGTLQTNTGLPFVWQVYALRDAPEPTLIAGSQSLYQIYLKEGQPVIEPLYTQGSDFASLQFLDSQDGQPGPYMEVYARNEASDLDRLDTLSGGRWLLISGHVVMDVQTRRTWLFNKDNSAVNNYSFPQPDGALAFSPNQKWIVFHAGFQSWNTPDSLLPDSEHAIVVYDFENDKGYAVVYDDTDTRMKDVRDVNLDWFNTYFEWNNSGDVLSLKKWDKLPNWTGRFVESDGYYYLYPVKAEMLPVFQEFVLQQMGWDQANILEDTTKLYTGRMIQLGNPETKLGIVFDEDAQQISFSRYLYVEDSPQYHELVKKIADAFDAELLSGKHQEYFGRIVSETKKIRSM